MWTRASGRAQAKRVDSAPNASSLGESAGAVLTLPFAGIAEFSREKLIIDYTRIIKYQRNNY